jgi:hypothetical protein
LTAMRPDTAPCACWYTLASPTPPPPPSPPLPCGHALDAARGPADAAAARGMPSLAAAPNDMRCRSEMGLRPAPRPPVVSAPRQDSSLIPGQWHGRADKRLESKGRSRWSLLLDASRLLRVEGTAKHARGPVGGGGGRPRKGTARRGDMQHVACSMQHGAHTTPTARPRRGRGRACSWRGPSSGCVP